jgi:hypothetical protein
MRHLAVKLAGRFVGVVSQAAAAAAAAAARSVRYVQERVQGRSWYREISCHDLCWLRSQFYYRLHPCGLDAVITSDSMPISRPVRVSCYQLQPVLHMKPTCIEPSLSHSSARPVQQNHIARQHPIPDLTPTLAVSGPELSAVVAPGAAATGVTLTFRRAPCTFTAACAPVDRHTCGMSQQRQQQQQQQGQQQQLSGSSSLREHGTRRGGLMLWWLRQQEASGLRMTCTVHQPLLL